MKVYLPITSFLGPAWYYSVFDPSSEMAQVGFLLTLVKKLLKCELQCGFFTQLLTEFFPLPIIKTPYIISRKGCSRW